MVPRASQPKDAIWVGLMGLGVVGSGVAEVLMEKADLLAREAGCPLKLKKVLVRDPQKRRSWDVGAKLLTTDPRDILEDPQIDIVVEVIGGESPAVDYIREALQRGKHLVTANKEVIAKYGAELLSLAQKHRVGILYEASAGGGIPLISPFRQDLLANRISAIHAIINGTTNYILTRMAKDKQDFGVALKRAKELGYAEPDPTNDIEGTDSAYKLAILATLAFHTVVHPDDIYREGISRLTARDFSHAQELGYAIKLLAIARKEDNTIQVRVHPVFVPEDAILAKVDDEFNAIQVEGDLVGKILFYGKGAGALPTSSAVISDVIKLAQDIRIGVTPQAGLSLEPGLTIKPISQLHTRYYLRMNVADRPGVLAQIARVLGDHNISIASVIQKETDVKAQSAEIVIMTHPSLESAMQKALQEMRKLAVVKEINNCIRVED